MDQQLNMAEPAKLQTPFRFSSDPTMFKPTPCLMPVSADGGMEIDVLDYRRTSSSSSTIEECYSTATSSFDEYVKVAEENLMDRRLYAHATTQGDDVEGFIKILNSISSKNDQLEHSKILCHISHRGNTCLHIAASFGHHELARYIMGECPDVVNMKNSDDDTALHIAARRRDLSLVKIVMNSSSRDLEISRRLRLRLTC